MILSKRRLIVTAAALAAAWDGALTAQAVVLVNDTWLDGRGPTRPADVFGAWHRCRSWTAIWNRCGTAAASGPSTRLDREARCVSI